MMTLYYPRRLSLLRSVKRFMQIKLDNLQGDQIAQLLQTIITTAQARSYRRLSLETGSTAHFQPAHTLYERFGFEVCEPFGSYTLDPHSVYMTRLL
jgi:putative acetyltransferase